MIKPFLVTLVAIAISMAVMRLSRYIPAPRPYKAPPRSRPPVPRPEPGPELAQVQAKAERALRMAYFPVVREGDAGPGASKVSGRPWLAPGEAWPACANCGRPMQLFLQLVADELPEPVRVRIGAGNAFQFFYCTGPDCESECETWEPFARSILLRMVPMQGAAQEGEMLPGMFPPKTITGWEAAEDFPDYEELEALGLDDDEFELLGDAYPLGGDKLAGWPLWVQGAEYPACRVCGSRMELLFQLESERILPWIFGDMGIGHVTQCPNHPSELAFQWAST